MKFLLILPPFLVMDLVWLGVVMKNFYAHELGDLARRQGWRWPRAGAPLFVYVLIPAGLVLFVRPRQLSPRQPLHRLAGGRLFGLVLYGVYDLTNLAVLEKWTLRMTLADIAWGCALCGTTAVLMRSSWPARRPQHDVLSCALKMTSMTVPTFASRTATKHRCGRTASTCSTG